MRRKCRACEARSEAATYDLLPQGVGKPVSETEKNLRRGKLLMRVMFAICGEKRHSLA